MTTIEKWAAIKLLDPSAKIIMVGEGYILKSSIYRSDLTITAVPRIASPNGDMAIIDWWQHMMAPGYHCVFNDKRYSYYEGSSRPNGWIEVTDGGAAVINEVARRAEAQEILENTAYDPDDNVRIDKLATAYMEKLNRQYMEQENDRKTKGAIWRGLKAGAGILFGGALIGTFLAYRDQNKDNHP